MHRFPRAAAVACFALCLASTACFIVDDARPVETDEGSGASTPTSTSSGTAGDGAGGGGDGGAGEAGDPSGGGGSSPDVGGSGGDQDGDGGGGGEVPPLPCNTLVNTAPAVTLQPRVGAAPTMTGGAISPGTFELVAALAFGQSPFTPTIQRTMVISGDASPQVVEHVEGIDGGPEQRGRFDLTTTGVEATMATTCGPYEPTTTWPYTYDPVADELHFLVQEGAFIQLVFRRLPAI